MTCFFFFFFSFFRFDARFSITASLHPWEDLTPKVFQAKITISETLASRPRGNFLGIAVTWLFFLFFSKIRNLAVHTHLVWFFVKTKPLMTFQIVMPNRQTQWKRRLKQSTRTLNWLFDSLGTSGRLATVVLVECMSWGFFWLIFHSAFFTETPFWDLYHFDMQHDYDIQIIEGGHPHCFLDEGFLKCVVS